MRPLVVASVRTDVAEFLSALLFVYSILIIIYVLAQLVFSLGARVPYSRFIDAVMNFLRDVCEPYLRPFRRIIPMIGPIDISPIVALIVLRIVGGLIVAAVHG
jgi:YggT family protein